MNWSLQTRKRWGFEVDQRAALAVVPREIVKNVEIRNPTPFRENRGL